MTGIEKKASKQKMKTITIIVIMRKRLKKEGKGIVILAQNMAQHLHNAVTTYPGTGVCSLSGILLFS